MTVSRHSCSHQRETRSSTGSFAVQLPPAVLATLALVLLAAAPAGAADKPNVVFILADDK